MLRTIRRSQKCLISPLTRVGLEVILAPFEYRPGFCKIAVLGWGLLGGEELFWGEDLEGTAVAVGGPLDVLLPVRELIVKW